MDDAMLVSAVKQGDIEAFNQLYEKYKNRVLRTAVLICGDITNGEEITQETFIKVYTNIGQLKNNAAFQAWMYQILHRTIWQLQSRNKNEYVDEHILEKADHKTTDTPLEYVIKDEEQNLVRMAVNSLDFKYRTVIVLYYYNELSTKEISKVLDCMEGTVKSRLFVARTQIRNYLEKGD